MSSQRRIEETVQPGIMQKLRNKVGNPSDPSADKAVQRSRYQFEATESDDELEDELDSNLDDISSLASRLNHLGRSMGQEVDMQNQRLTRVSDKTSDLDSRIYAGTQRLDRLR